MLRLGEEEVLHSLLSEAFAIMAMFDCDDAPDEVKEMVRTWILKSHAMMCPNHEEVVVELLRMYNASSN